MSLLKFMGLDGKEITAYEATPKGEAIGNIILLQELFGINSHIRSVADDYASQGYHVIAPAFFDHVQQGIEMGYAQEDVKKGLELRDQLPWDLVLKDVESVCGLFKNDKKIALLGYCWGGLLAWVGSARLNGLTAVVSYYGGGIGNYAEEQPKCPVMCHFGETDKLVPPAAIEKIKSNHPETVEVHVYQAGHGFNCDQRGSFHAESAKLARERTLAFLKEKLA
ncbi:dienelactone hydrolase family protein [Pusillimonas sp.]|uniref:dienelactone hydrolase family protein n=1 Tax=Pusillimonas sp. TaxID=3040095 RepID=UPI0037C572B2